MEAPARKQTTAHRSSHSEDGAGEGGWDGYPSDQGLQTALQKLNVRHSDDRGHRKKMRLHQGRPIGRSVIEPEPRRGVNVVKLVKALAMTVSMNSGRATRATTTTSARAACADGGDATLQTFLKICTAC